MVMIDVGLCSVLVSVVQDLGLVMIGLGLAFVFVLVLPKSRFRIQGQSSFG